ncbi:MAG: hypothetical protein BWY87_01261 [Deltaproteobacteria bacterium ADurb.Bin510]|nr:MAG: hypothetical protein BWY87_01261 [Deltaproteobacteria bacterium ADurb.Bin510]
MLQEELRTEIEMTRTEFQALGVELLERSGALRDALAAGLKYGGAALGGLVAFKLGLLAIKLLLAVSLGLKLAAAGLLAAGIYALSRQF